MAKGVSGESGDHRRVGLESKKVSPGEYWQVIDSRAHVHVMGVMCYKEPVRLSLKAMRNRLGVSQCCPGDPL